MTTDEERKKLREASEKSAAKARLLLDEEVTVVMQEVARIRELKPATADQVTYDKLIQVIEEATIEHYKIATIKKNIEELGEGAMSLFKEMASLARGRV